VTAVKTDFAHKHLMTDSTVLPTLHHSDLFMLKSMESGLLRQHSGVLQATQICRTSRDHIDLKLKANCYVGCWIMTFINICNSFVMCSMRKLTVTKRT